MKKPGHRWELRGGWRQGRGLGVSRLLLTNGLAGGHGAVFVTWAHLGLGTTEANSQPLPCTREDVSRREGVVPSYHSIHFGLSWVACFWVLCF